MAQLIANLVPRWLVYWCGIRLWADSTMGDNAIHAPDVTLDEALKRWDA